MQIVKKSGALRVYAGDGMARGLFIGKNIKTGKMCYGATQKKSNYANAFIKKGAKK